MADTNTTGTQTETTQTENGQTETTTQKPNGNETIDVNTLMAELAQIKAESAKTKSALDKALREKGEVTKALRAKQSAEDIEAEEKAKQEAEREAYVKGLERERDLNKAIKRYMTTGMPEDLATETANFELDNDMDSVFKNVKKNQERIITEQVKAEQEKWIASRPQVNVGTGGKCPVTKEQFDKMGYSERAKLYSENPEVYKEYANK